MKPTIKFVLLMLVCGIIIVLYALLPERPTLIGDWGPRQVELRRLLTKDQPVMPIQRVSKNPDATPREKSDTTRQRILLFGDSMAGLVCYRLSQYAEENGHTLDAVSWTSSTTGTWANSGKLQEYINKVRPTYIFIALGSNELTSRDMTTMERNVRTIYNIIGDIPTVWIGPPNWCKDGGINNLLEQLLGSSNFFLSKDLKLARRADGRHPTLPAAQQWMDAVVRWMNSGKAEYMIKMNKPVRKKGVMDYTVLFPDGRIQVEHGHLVGGGSLSTPAMEQSVNSSTESGMTDEPLMIEEEDYALPEHSKTLPAPTASGKEKETTVEEKKDSLKK